LTETKLQHYNSVKSRDMEASGGMLVYR